MRGTARLAGFYEKTYTPSNPSEGMLYADWRALSAVGKAKHVVTLCEAAALVPTSTLDVGCGDGALLCELRRGAFGGCVKGLEIAPQAVAISRNRPEIDAVDLYDGERLSLEDDSISLGILSHVLEHVHDPAGLLAEVARVCQAVVVEVPLEANISARRHAKRAHAKEVGHVQRLSRSAMRAIVADAGLWVAGELEDPLPLAVHRFFARTPLARAVASIRWGVRAGLHRLAPGLAKRVFTVHYACLCLPLDGRSPVR
jgi:SAM-dependent methyltransferase